MSRPKGSINKPKININPSAPIIQQVQSPSPSQYVTVSPVQFSEDFAVRYIKQYSKFMENFASIGQQYYNPIYANSQLKRFNVTTKRPTTNDLVQWLNNPKYHEQDLQACSEWLTTVCEFYTRTIYYAANILNFDYELIPINPPDITASKKDIKLYKQQKKKNNDWLRQFRVKEQCSNIMIDIVRQGGKAYYLRHSNNSDYLQAMPDNYIYINGRTDITGYTYSMNMSFFYQYSDSISGFAPEFYEWYKEFLTEDGKFNKNIKNVYRRMPIEKAVVFKFDDTRPEIIPPFTGVFKDALEVQDYQDLLKLKAQLQTFQLLYLEIPKDEKGVPTISAQDSINYVAVAQTQVPTGTGIVSTPMKLEQIDFDTSQNFNNIIGLGMSNYYEAAGLSPAIFGQATKSAVGITNSIQTDYLMFEHMYDQFERFINYQLSFISGKHDFMVRFIRRSNYNLNEDVTNSFKLLDHGGPVTRVLSAMGYEPWAHENSLIDNALCDMTNLLRVPVTAFTKSGKEDGGRPTSETKGDPMTDENDQTRSDGGNSDKGFSLKHKCKFCDESLIDNNEYSDFCDINCLCEYATELGGE
jgi:hypothetical protein